jgi:FlaA1/EpsC-like NDP-sugar epimerase
MLKNIFKKIKRTPTTRKIFFLVNDLFWIPLAVYLSFLLRFEAEIPEQYFGSVLVMGVLSVFFLIPIFNFNKLYSFSWSFVSAEELISLVKSSVFGFSALGAILFIFKDRAIFYGFPRSTFFVSFFLIILFCGGIRFLKRIYLQIFKKRLSKFKEKTLIIGAGDAGEQFLRSILTLKSSFFYPVGFIDDNDVKQGVTIHGLKVLGKISDIPRIVKENQIEVMVIALPSAGSDIIKKSVEKGREAGVKKIKVIPSLTEIVDGQISIADLKDLKIEELLQREPVFLNLSSIENFIKDKKILITGAAGSIGSELSRQVAKFSPSLVILLDQDETGIFNISGELKNKFPAIDFSAQVADIQDENKIDYIFNKFQPQILFHAAAYKHVPLMEEHPDEAVKNNIFGTKIVAEKALKYKLEKFIFISTDKAVKPSSVMGATKRIGEMFCQFLNKKNNTKFISVRFGNVLDSRGSIIPIFKEQIKKGGPLEITHPEMKRYFMMISEACLLVMQAAEMGQGGEVFVLDMGKPIKILDLAREMIRLTGLEPDKDIPIVFTKPRPGEKLFEEILTAEEGILATKNKKIFSAKLSDISGEKLENSIKKLEIILKEREKAPILEVFKDLIPYFKNI